MKITIFAAGSRGDIQPCVALGKGLKQAGYQVQLAAPHNFADFVESHGVGFYPLRGDVQSIMAGETGREFMETGGGNLIKSIRGMRAMIGPIALEMAADAHQACQQSDAIICLGVMSAFGSSIAEAVNLPLVNIEPTPLLPTRTFPAPGWPIQKNLGGLHNYLSGMAMLKLIWLWYQPFVNDFRASLGLSRLSFLGFHRQLRETPLMSAYSQSVISRPPDWPGSVHITGYLFLDSSGPWQPPSDLSAFLAAGDPPVYIGFGSMAGRKPKQLAAIVLGALAETNQRGLLLQGWGGLRAEHIPANVFMAESVPHSWLFPRVSAVVHHGGAGTTAEGLRAGAPTVIVPFAFDQAFWGARVKAVGAGPDSIPQKELTVDKLAQAIRLAVSDPSIRRHAEEIGKSIRTESGMSKAVEVIEKYFKDTNSWE